MDWLLNLFGLQRRRKCFWLSKLPVTIVNSNQSGESSVLVVKIPDIFISQDEINHVQKSIKNELKGTFLEKAEVLAITSDEPNKKPVVFFKVVDGFGLDNVDLNRIQNIVIDRLKGTCLESATVIVFQDAELNIAAPGMTSERMA